MSELNVVKNLAVLPPVQVRADLVASLRNHSDRFWQNHCNSQLTIVRLGRGGKPDNPILVVEPENMQGVQREISYKNVRSANGVPLPPPKELEKLI